MKIMTLRRVTFAGPFDAVAIMLIIFGVLLTHPFFIFDSEYKRFFVIFLFCAAGAGWLINERILFILRERFVLKVQHQIPSSPLIVDPKDDETIKNSMLFGYTADGGLPLYLPYEVLMRHVSIIGQSGSGKTVLGEFMMQQHIMKGGGYLFVDGKMNLDALINVIQMARQAGRESDVLIINPADPALSNTYNPVLFGDPDEVTSRIMGLIPVSEGNAGTDYFRQSSNQALLTLLSALQFTGKAYNFMDLSILLMNGTALFELERTLVRQDPQHEITNMFRLFLDAYRTPKGAIDMTKIKDVFGGLAGRLYDFGTGTFGTVMNTYSPEVDMYEAIRNNKIIYVMLPTMGKNERAQNLGKLVIGDLRSTIARIQLLPKNERPWPPFLTFADEAGSYVNQSWPRMFEQGRSAQIILVPSIQTQANFNVISDDLGQMVLGNTLTKIFFSIGERQSQEAAATEIGEADKTIYMLNESKGASKSGLTLNSSPNKNEGDSAASGLTQRSERTNKVTPEQIASLQQGQCLVTHAGSNLYNIIVPFSKLTPAVLVEYGDIRINRFKMPDREGLNLFDRAQEFLSG